MPTLSLGLLFVGPSLAKFHGREHTPSRSVKGGPQSEVGVGWGEIMHAGKAQTHEGQSPGNSEKKEIEALGLTDFSQDT